MSTESEVLVGRCYTKARRHPSVVGRWPWAGGGRIPGGPYAVQQLVVAIGLFGLLFLTRGVWAVGSVWLTGLVLVGVPVAGALVSGRLRVDGRSPLWAGVSALAAFTRPAPGEERRVRARTVRGTCHLSDHGAEPRPETVPGGRGAPAVAGRAAPARGQGAGAPAGGGSVRAEAVPAGPVAGADRVPSAAGALVARATAVRSERGQR